MDQPAHDTHFGACWHIAREHQLIHGYDDIAGAMTKAMAEYRKEFPPETDAFYLPKTPSAILAGLITFAEQHKIDEREFEVVEIDGVKMTEISGTVPISDKRILHYKMDCILRSLETSKIRSRDHKTTSGKWIHDTRWDEELYLSIQNGTYTHCLYCMFPIEEVEGVEFVKTGFEYLERGSKNRSAGYHATTRYIPAFKTPQQMNVWLWNVNSWLDQIDFEMERLFHCNEEDDVLMAFPLNPKSCTAYKGCPYHEFCLAWSNPLQRVYQPPLGFRVEYWDPREMKTTNKRNLEWRR
jgi:hypothetical protein